jgi:hypothetical protein
MTFEGQTIGYIEKVRVDNGRGYAYSTGWQPQDTTGEPLTDYSDCMDRALEWVAEQ